MRAFGYLNGRGPTPNEYALIPESAKIAAATLDAVGRRTNEWACRTMLHFIKQGKTVEQARVLLTHTNVHTIWQSNTPKAKHVRSLYPLELRLPKLGEPDEVIDCRDFKVPWDVSLPTPAPKLSPSSSARNATESRS